MADVGRPTVMTPATIDKLEEVFSLGGSDLEACGYAGISKTALYEYQNANPDFAERKSFLKEKPILLARRSVLAHIADDGDLALKFLERKNKAEFSVRSELTGAEGKPLIMAGEVAQKHEIGADAPNA